MIKGKVGLGTRMKNTKLCIISLLSANVSESCNLLKGL